MTSKNTSWKVAKAFIDEKNKKCLSKSTYIIENLNKICRKYKFTIFDLLLYFDYLSRISDFKFGSNFYFYEDLDKDKFINFFCFDSLFRSSELYKKSSYTAYTRVVIILKKFSVSLQNFKSNNFNIKNRNISKMQLDDLQYRYNDIVSFLDDLLDFYVANETYTIVEKFPEKIYKKYYSKQKFKRTNILDFKYEVKKENDHVLCFSPASFFISSFVSKENNSSSKSEFFICFFLVFFELTFIFGVAFHLIKDLYTNRKLYFDFFYYDEATDFGSVFLNLTLPSFLLIFSLIVFYFFCISKIIFVNFIFVYLFELIIYILWICPFVDWMFKAHNDRKAICN